MVKWNEENNKKLLEAINQYTVNGTINYKKVAYILRLPENIIKQKHLALQTKLTPGQVEIIESEWLNSRGKVSFQDLKKKTESNSILDIKKQLSDSVTQKGLLPFYSFSVKNFNKFDKDFWTQSRKDQLFALAKVNQKDRKVDFKAISETMKQSAEICQKQLFLLYEPFFTTEENKTLITMLLNSAGKVGSRKLQAAFASHSLFGLLLQIDHLQGKDSTIPSKDGYYED
ncbi:hypothetical protein SS50377_21087 [Spironucleus salmonicida]|uniref:Uncharacterized protein n=1 Tax=Spironucleus salmonicida TaxID=348837 RepID=V6LHU2_9EUKA|nr:hypothetical protein SS50377_21087 [Spironucleus salmonicida]|eukprot:EST43873.1 Hypothetical protein SS50377_16173 [Spironucleus salmonicida]